MARRPAAKDSPALPPETSGKNTAALTPIHGRIHWAATDAEEEAANEMDTLVVDTFLETLAEIALAIARRDGQGMGG